MSSRAASLAYRSGWALVKRAPLRPSRATFLMLGELSALRNGKGTKRLRENLRRVTGLRGQPLEDLTHAGMRSYMRYWLEVFQLPAMDPVEVAAKHAWEGEEHLAEAHARGKGVVLALPHMGNWDVAGVWLVENYGTFTTVAERLEPEDLFEQFVEFRESLGMEVIAHKGHEQPPVEVLAERLRAGRIVCLLADRDMSEHGVPVDFFDGRASYPAGPAVLALRTGAAVLPVTLHTHPTDRFGWAGIIHPPVEGDDVASLTQAVADVFATQISLHPEDWHMLGRVWKD